MSTDENNSGWWFPFDFLTKTLYRKSIVSNEDLENDTNKKGSKSLRRKIHNNNSILLVDEDGNLYSIPKVSMKRYKKSDIFSYDVDFSNLRNSLLFLQCKDLEKEYNVLFKLLASLNDDIKIEDIEDIRQLFSSELINKLFSMAILEIINERDFETKLSKIVKGELINDIRQLFIDKSQYLFHDKSFVNKINTDKKNLNYETIYEDEEKQRKRKTNIQEKSSKNDQIHNDETQYKNVEENNQQTDEFQQLYEKRISDMNEKTEKNITNNLNLLEELNANGIDITDNDIQSLGMNPDNILDDPQKLLKMNDIISNYVKKNNFENTYPNNLLDSVISTTVLNDNRKRIEGLNIVEHPNKERLTKDDLVK
jgi:hypothetical protein